MKDKLSRRDFFIGLTGIVGGGFGGYVVHGQIDSQNLVSQCWI